MQNGMTLDDLLSLDLAAVADLLCGERAKSEGIGDESAGSAPKPPVGSAEQSERKGGGVAFQQAIDALLASVPDDRRIPYGSEMRTNYDALDRTVWVEACRLGLDGKLPEKSNECLGLTNLPGVTLIDGSFVPTGVNWWRNRLLALYALAEPAAHDSPVKLAAGEATSGRIVHRKALERVLDELDSWADFPQSESSEEYFPAAIEQGHPLWLTIVALQRFYPKNRLPKLGGAFDAWAKLCKYSRQHGGEDRYTQRDRAVEAAEVLRRWACGEEARVRDVEESLARKADPAPSIASLATPIVFISSTIEDLSEYRAKARDAVNQVGFVPRMKEHFAASGNPPLQECLQKVSGSRSEPPADVVVLIVAHRYGWVPENQPGSDRKSITWLECERAHQDGKEVLAFLVNKTTNWPKEFREEHSLAEEIAKGTGTAGRLQEIQDNVARLARFKEWLGTISTWNTFDTPDSLQTGVLRALYEWQSRHPRISPLRNTGK
jgi:hypothetical protein